MYLPLDGLTFNADANKLSNLLGVLTLSSVAVIVLFGTETVEILYEYNENEYYHCQTQRHKHVKLTTKFLPTATAACLTPDADANKLSNLLGVLALSSVAAIILFGTETVNRLSLRNFQQLLAEYSD